ncbi:hypothetical protein KC660_03215 [Candidatus Dojkabacteria bacterium]|uniref:Cell division protein FtsL n=1 Tax=Candidatus Dojkabacteria bacterium TaxID=2099670 RepID=A0A955L3Y5_9BACT|nr:hypothetical protein [Candidatus Dojkabacteria bacterium]
MRQRSYRSRRGMDANRTSSKIKVSPTAFLIILSLVIFVFTQLIYLSLFGTKGRDISEVQFERESINQEIQQIQQKIANLNNLENVERVAVDELGMVKGSEVRYINKQKQVSSNVNLNE